MGGIDKILVCFFSAQAGIHFVMVCKRIAMFGAVRHVVFDHGVQPDCGYPQPVEIVEMVLYAFQVAPVTVEYGIPVQTLVAQAGHPVIAFVAITKTVGHDQVDQVAAVDAGCKIPAVTRPPCS